MDDVALPETCCAEATVWVGLGGAAYLGPSLRLREHSGSVHCFALGLDAPFTINGEPGVRSALIPARTPNHLESAGGRMLFLYRDPSTAWLDGLRARMTSLDSVHIGHRDELALAEEARGGRLPLLSPLGEPADARISTALRLLRADREGRLSVAEVAKAVNLSASRFQHLFSAHTGTSFRRYRLWARMQHVGTAVGAGRTLTTAAVDAGFASPGHFSDSFRTMFGLSATRLLTPATRLVVLDRP
ncbi:helix-turn-helix domain-containing protein [Amycolatopsis magusensis]|uniref:helix-turn-helix domain-containing protein n=1 Tax=Amycolatopsis magusensis TaxID=882444 RepID=UPI003792F423